MEDQAVQAGREAFQSSHQSSFGHSHSQDSNYFSNARTLALFEVAASCGTSIAALSNPALLAATTPIAGVVLATAALGFAGCVAFTAVVLAAPDDKSVENSMQAERYVGPGLWIAPVGAMAAGEAGMRVAADVGNVTLGAFELSDATKIRGMSSLLVGSTAAAAFYFDHVDLNDSTLLLLSQPKPLNDLNSPAADPVFSPGQGYDLNTINPPGLGDLSTPTSASENTIA